MMLKRRFRAIKNFLNSNLNIQSDVIQTINYNLDNRLIKKIIFFNTSEGYSIEQNQLIIACVKQNVEVIVLENNPKTPTINAILY